MKAEHSGISRIEHRVDLLDGRHARQLLRELRRGNQRGGVLLDFALLRQPPVERAQRRQRARHRSLAEAAFVEVRQIATDENVIDVAPALRANVVGKLRQIGAIGLDGVRGSVALLQRANEVRDCLLHDGCALRHWSCRRLQPRRLLRG